MTKGMMPSFKIKAIIEMEITEFKIKNKEDAVRRFKRMYPEAKDIEIIEDEVCSSCEGKGWVWGLKKEYNLNDIPAGNFARTPEMEEKQSCSMCGIRKHYKDMQKQEPAKKFKLVDGKYILDY